MSDSVLGTAPSPATDGIRCSDAEREQVRAALYAAAGEGRLTMDEVEDRLGRLEEARFRHELAAMTADLPAPETAEVATGWRPVLAAAGRTLAADVAVLLGRSAQPAPARRRVLMIVVAVIVLLLLASVVAQGFEPHGFEPRGPMRG
ncbi:DUF1707 domain-containing protein [Amycolatopsis sp. NBC_01488]|uniref:DUF1707 SHOCT-like domain-containing protein n=1 Tax=Amycolatopsis sp. NBC_01488 TaxID=2903563 RepID=UPI002E2C67FE|nr:DUF1707 domain-containing protein [Amycolatopsis sp. NBC_01488]